MAKVYITNDEMDVTAKQLLINAGIPTFWQGTVNKVNVDALIEFEYGLDIQWKDIDHFAQDGVVLAAIIPERKLIYMNEAKKDLFMQKMGTMNFSKAHELGHWVLHVVEQLEYEQLSFTEHDTFYCRNTAKKSPQEIQADMFAASILMPKDIVCGVINQMKESGRVTFPDLYRLKDSFEVSISALAARVQELKLLYIVDKKIYFSEAEAIGQITLF